MNPGEHDDNEAAEEDDTRSGAVTQTSVQHGGDTVHHLAALYADISGSTRLYEQYGDTVARRDVSICLKILVEIAGRHGGKLLATLGDEVLCGFPQPQRAARAAADMHDALRAASAAGRFRTGALRVKIGWHYGLAEWRDGELVGATPAIAQQIIRLARPEEILASGTAIEMLPSDQRASAQLIDTVESCVDGLPLTVYKLPWEESEEATQFRHAPVAAPPTTQHRLVLRHGDCEVRLDDQHRHCTIGRGAGNDLATGSRFTSKRHAEISWHQGRFHISDCSVNGTLVAPRGGAVVHLHRETGVLTGEGELWCGANASSDAAAAVHYRCE